jgi:beta-phosphoglucomutase-like phosphatase (HAD superfamily)
MHFRGILLDLDGTLVNSLDFVEASWSLWATKKGWIRGRYAIISTVNPL